jgi:2-keto-4-pentenoate hydratase/2-oxohepta-3-ene-1,7-dioic acid hydratase in catechol pathway
MKLCRFDRDGKHYHGLVEGDSVRVLAEGVFGDTTKTLETFSLGSVRLLAPCLPTKAICIGLNYRDHAMELGTPIPESPVVFLKPPSSLIGPGDGIEYPELSFRVDYEGELAIVIGRRARKVTRENAADHILGYTCANDVTARDLQSMNGQWTIAKGFDTFMPLGPWIVTDLDPSDLKLRTLLNGEVKQSSSTKNLIFDAYFLVSWLSRIMTLEPGDVILTGTPSGISPMKVGDEVIVEIEGIGRLFNPIR